MTNKNILIVALVFLLGGLSLYLNRDWFATEEIHISHRSSSPRNLLKQARAAKTRVKTAANPVVFFLNRKVKLTSVKVVLASDIQTNEYPHAIWNLVSDSNSIPVRDFIYGAPIRGMRLAVKGVPADPLQPGVNYRLLIEAGSDKAEHDFVPVPTPRPR
jgi:hypothetical protein